MLNVKDLRKVFTRYIALHNDWCYLRKTLFTQRLNETTPFYEKSRKYMAQLPNSALRQSGTNYLGQVHFIQTLSMFLLQN